MLTKETMQQILEEEKYRNEVKKSLEIPTPARKRGKIMEFLNSTFFLALLSSLLIPIIISYAQSNSQKLKEKEAFDKKISNERAEIKNRIDIISRIDPDEVDAGEYSEIINAYKGYDSIFGFSLIPELAKRNIYSLIADYEFDLKYEKVKKGNDSIIASIPAVTKALREIYSYLEEFHPYMNLPKAPWSEYIEEKARIKNNPSIVDFYMSWSKEKDSLYKNVLVPEIRKFQ